MALLTYALNNQYTLNSINNAQNEALMMAQILCLSKTRMMAKRYSILKRCYQFLKSLFHLKLSTHALNYQIK
ncbi:MAG: hypothetical protein AB7F64_04160 [Gammaproteobacteria bacterium]